MEGEGSGAKGSVLGMRSTAILIVAFLGGESLTVDDAVERDERTMEKERRTKRDERQTRSKRIAEKANTTRRESKLDHKLAS